MDAVPPNPATALRLVLVRGVVLAAIWIAWYWLVPVVWNTEGDANIGAGLLGFGLLVLAAGMWAFLDGRRLPPALGITVWVLAPVVGSVAASVNQWLTETDAGEHLPVSDLAGTAVFVAVLIAGPALLAFLAGRTTGRTVVG